VLPQKGEHGVDVPYKEPRMRANAGMGTRRCETASKELRHKGTLKMGAREIWDPGGKSPGEGTIGGKGSVETKSNNRQCCPPTRKPRPSNVNSEGGTTMIEITTHLAHPRFTGQRSEAEASWQGNGDGTVDETTTRGCSGVMCERVGLGARWLGCQSYT